MTVNDFKRRFVRGLIAPELFLLPDPAEREQPQSDELIIEVVVAANVSLNFGIYSITSVNNNSYESVRPINGAPSKPYDSYSCWQPIQTIVDSEGGVVNRETYPEIFSDYPIHTVSFGRISGLSDNLITGGIDLTVDWGDGTTTNHIGSDVSPTKALVGNVNLTIAFASSSCKNNIQHTYTEAGTYQIKIKGNCPFPLVLPSQTAKLIAWGRLGLRSVAWMFQNCVRNITEIAVPQNGELDHVVSIAYMFGSSNSNINENILPWEFFKKLPNLVCASWAFAYSSYTAVPDEAFAGLQYLTEVCQMFYNCSKLVSIGSSVFKNCKNLMDCSELAYYSSVQTVGDSVFEGCGKLYSVCHAFYYARSLKTVGKNIFKNCSMITDVQYMFNNCEELQSIGEGIFAGCESIRSAYNMLYYCNKLKSIPANLFGDLKISDYVTNNFNFHNWIYTYYNSSYGTPEECRIHIGGNMFGSFLSQGGTIAISETFGIGESYAYIDGVTEYYSGYSGEVPNFWDYPKQIYIPNRNAPQYKTVADLMAMTPAEIHELSDNNKFPIYGYFGSQAGRAFDLCKNGGKNMTHYASNYSSIPQPIGRVLKTPDAVWLSPTIFTEFKITLVAPFTLFEADGSATLSDRTVAGHGGYAPQLLVNGSRRDVCEGESGTWEIVVGYGVNPLASTLTGDVSVPRDEWIGTGAYRLEVDVPIYYWLCTYSGTRSQPILSYGDTITGFKHADYTVYDGVTGEEIASVSLHNENGVINLGQSSIRGEDNKPWEIGSAGSLPPGTILDYVCGLYGSFDGPGTADVTSGSYESFGTTYTVNSINSAVLSKMRQFKNSQGLNERVVVRIYWKSTRLESTAYKYPAGGDPGDRVYYTSLPATSTTNFSTNTETVTPNAYVSENYEHYLEVL